MTDDLARLHEDVTGIRRPLHELGNLLAIVIGQAEYLLHESDPPDHDEALEAIRTAALDARDRIRHIQTTLRQASAAAPRAKAAPTGPASRVLIIDDEVEVRETFATLFRQMGHEVETTGSGEDGVRRYQARRFDCVVTDLVMPELDGIGLLSALRDLGNKVPVVVMTADVQKTTRARCEELGAIAFLNKPVNAMELRSVVAHALMTEVAQ